MHRRGFLSALFLIATAITVAVPLFLVVAAYSVQVYRSGSLGQLRFLGFNAYWYPPETLNGAKLVQDRLYRAIGRSSDQTVNDGRLVMSSVELDKNTEWDGDGTRIQSNELGYHPGWSHTVLGDAHNLWILSGARNTKNGWFRDVMKVEGDKFISQAPMPLALQRPIAVSQPTSSGLQQEEVLSEAFVLGGKLSTIYSPTIGRRELYQLIEGKWVSRGVIELLDVSRTWKNSSNETILEPLRSWGSGNDGILEVSAVGDVAQLFWRLPGRLLYRRGFQLRDDLTASDNSVADHGEPQTQAVEAADNPTNATGVTDEWLLVSNDIPHGTTWFPAFAGGEPIVVVIREKQKGYPVATALRLEGGHWVQYSQLELPFSSHAQSLGSREGGSATYLAATTQLRRGGIYEVGPMGIQQTDMRYALRPDGDTGYILAGFVLVWSMIAAMILVLVATVCMCRDRARYEFGHQSVELASVMERAIARAIDGILILLLMSGLARLLAMLWDFDWRTTVEAMQARVFDHPSFAAGSRIALIVLASLLAMALLYIAVQGRFSVTPGKWLCGLRTVQSSLRPCGFSKSLLREILLFVENLLLICWTPAILLIAFTELRQRLGDLIADTIVVRARLLQLPSTSPAEAAP